MALKRNRQNYAGLVEAPEPLLRETSKIAPSAEKRSRRRRPVRPLDADVYPIEQRVLDIYKGMSKLREVKVAGRPDDAVLADIFGAAFPPLS